MTTINQFKLFWAWQDEQEETWLREMAREGWHLESAKPFGQYTFTSGAPGDYAYRLDFQTSAQKDLGNYLKLFEDSGWEFVGDMMGWKYFRKPAKPGEDPEIFTDNQSKIQKYQRLLGYLVIFVPIWIILISSVFDREATGLFTFLTFLKLLSAGMLVLYSYIFIKIFQRINQLKRRNL
jgi:hypothetical protein